MTKITAPTPKLTVEDFPNTMVFVHTMLMGATLLAFDYDIKGLRTKLVFDTGVLVAFNGKLPSSMKEDSVLPAKVKSLKLGRVTYPYDKDYLTVTPHHWLRVMFSTPKGQRAIVLREHYDLSITALEPGMDLEYEVSNRIFAGMGLLTPPDVEVE